MFLNGIKKRISTPVVKRKSSKLSSRKKPLKKKNKDEIRCLGVGVVLEERPISNSSKYTGSGRSFQGQYKQDDEIPEEVYKHFTESDSRPLTPRALPRPASLRNSPEFEARPSTLHSRRVLILDLRRVRSLEALTRQNSTGTSGSSASSPLLLPSRSRSPTPRKQQRPRASQSPAEYFRSSSPKILEGLTLPPLHSSVLTLLGAKAALKPQQPLTSTTVKKLRRHGRKKKKEAEVEIIPEETAVGDPSREPSEQPEIPVKKGLFNEEEIVPLWDALEPAFAGEEWTGKVDYKEEKKLEKKLKKVQTTFPASRLGVRESFWLSLPKTWTHGVATFSFPAETKKLKTMSPMEYLTECLTVVEARVELYSFVFQRWRTLENPTRMEIVEGTVDRALGEALGRRLDKEEFEIMKKALFPQGENVKLTEDQFVRVATFAERIFGNPSLEDSPSCFSCIQRPRRNMESCHLNQRNDIEKADFEFIGKKLKDRAVGEKLEQLLKLVYFRSCYSN